VAFGLLSIKFVWPNGKIRMWTIKLAICHIRVSTGAEQLALNGLSSLCYFLFIHSFIHIFYVLSNCFAIYLQLSPNAKQ